MPHKHASRRRFLTAAAASAAAPFILPGRVWSADVPPSEKLRMGFIGMGTQARGLLSKFLGDERVLVTAVCDVDTDRRNAAKEKVDTKYGNKDCKAVNDFREITESKDFDAVCIATPDHWHAVISISALSNGKDVYCEKPLTHNIHEAVAVTAAARQHNRVLQTGSMQRSMSEFRIAAELVRNGVIGDIKTVETSFGDPAKPNANPEEPMQPGLDWDRWCGPGPLVPYSPVLSPRGVHQGFPAWRMTREFGGGMITDWGAHHIDIAQWGLNMDGSGPVEVKAPADWDSPKARGAQLIYANGVVLTHVNGKGCSFFGTEGEVHVNRGKFELVLGGKRKFGFWDKEVDKGTSLQREYTLAEREFLANAKVKLYNSKDQIQDFLACVKSREKPVCDVAIGASSAIACHLMNFAYWYNGSFKWDPAKTNFVSGGDPKWLTREYRGEFKVA
ncbi:Gfo/Idh/MocA family oxidoreductase [Roseimicrobium sp. ORNL1]|uniref:Gfo/Idh/MocA family protein n=1 Tax=Roseimicrobium sp. ORNL1 TaxID=2711231 RepID=UPI0013E18316|nr:Gfo/Idh/MocA family oxidoreductase [Roseimicrobium sp. ORNL1]QIF05541.1 Gfo/Idh/MocA family oxidoreductase [Roseimicrobium sp. ORNL1]